MRGTRLTDPDPRVLCALARAVGDAGVRHGASDRLAYAHDASHYLLTPQAVVTPASVAEMVRLLQEASTHRVPLTFRSGGTSLSGQAGTDGVLVDTRRSFRGVEVVDGGERVRVQPGATVRQVNARLAPLGRKLGPDPASEAASTIGGVVANNSSGMLCGTKHNAYETLESAVFVLPGGTVVDSADADADRRLQDREPRLHAGLARLRNRIRSSPHLVEIIEQQYSMKNTMGYGLNSFLDCTRPVDILTRLLVGSEGTLAFVAEATFRTLPVQPHAVTTLVVFDDLSASTGALPAVLESDPAAIELLDAAALRVAQDDQKAPGVLRQLAVRDHSALLVEWQGMTGEELQETMSSAARILASLPAAAPSEPLRDARSRAEMWAIRKGLYAAVAGARPSGTTALLEDVAVPVPALLGTCRELLGLFDRFRYDGTVVFGHAKDGNLHFMLNERFDTAADVSRYQSFTEELVDVVLGQRGTLKAEHGTGRMMAPYVRRQFGDELYDVMREVKALCDPHGVLNPGVVVNDDPTVHLQHLKVVPTVEPEVDRCVECGYCEPVCPSRDLTTTPRQRIVLRRELAAARAAGDEELVRELEDRHGYDVVDTCAVDGMCQTACPVLINTGDLVRRLRSESAGSVQRRAWTAAVDHWGAVTTGAAAALTTAAALPAPVTGAVSRAARRVTGGGLPLWTRDLPRGGVGRRPLGAATGADAVFFPACTGSVFGPAPPEPGVTPAFRDLCRRAGVALVTPPEISRLCCGTPWSSKGMPDGWGTMAGRVAEVLAQASAGGRIPVVCDASSCTEGLRKALSAGPWARTESRPVVLDSVEFVWQHVLPRLIVRRRLQSLTLHPTCSSERTGSTAAMEQLAAAIAERVVVPVDWGCCAFAGDRGLTHPELTAAATAAEAAAVALNPTDAYVSTNRPCEMAMSRATGQQYQHLVEVVDWATR